MEATKLVLEIDIGNDAMKSRDDLVTALEKAITQIRQVGFKDGISINIMDINGNTVGHWRYGP